MNRKDRTTMLTFTILRKIRRGYGMCGNCGREKIDKRSKSRCRKCLDKVRDYNRRVRGGKPLATLPQPWRSDRWKELKAAKTAGKFGVNRTLSGAMKAKNV